MAELTAEQLQKLAPAIDVAIQLNVGSVRGFLCFVITTDDSGSDIQCVGNISQRDSVFICEQYAKNCRAKIN